MPARVRPSWPTVSRPRRAPRVATEGSPDGEESRSGPIDALAWSRVVVSATDARRGAAKCTWWFPVARSSSFDLHRMTSIPGRVAGIDYGSRRIGVALTDPEQRIASPLQVYTRRDPKRDADYFCALVKEYEVVRFVVGLPLHTDERESRKSAEARAFGSWLQQVTGVPVVYFDERFTTLEAEQVLWDAGLTREKRRQRLDMVAAQRILADYLAAHWRDSGDAGAELPGTDPPHSPAPDLPRGPEA